MTTARPWTDRAIDYALGAFAVAAMSLPWAGNLAFDKDRIGAGAAIAAVLVSILFNRSQGRVIAQTLRESSLRVEPHLAVSRIELRRDTWSELAVEMNVFNVGLGHVFLVSAQLHWRARSARPHETELSAAKVAKRSIGDTAGSETLPFVLEDGQHAVITFNVGQTELGLALQSEMPVGDSMRRQTTPSEYLEGYIELHFRGVGDGGVRPPLRADVNFADARIVRRLAAMDRQRRRARRARRAPENAVKAIAKAK